MKIFSFKRNNSGFTLIELILVIAITGILSSMAVPRFSGITNGSKVRVDEANLGTLNKVTQMYAVTTSTGSDDIFEGTFTDGGRIQDLVNSNLLNEIVKPKQDKVAFKWIKTDQLWTMGLSSIIYGSGGTSMEELLKNPLIKNKWKKNDLGGIKPIPGGTEQLLFEPNNNEEYTIKSKAQLGVNDNGGYGIFFETSVNRVGDLPIDTGYIFQFDKGYSQDGAILVKQRKDGAEVSNSSKILTPSVNAEIIIPSAKEDPEWWKDKHDIQLKVSSLEGNKKKLTVYIDNKLFSESYEFVSNTTADNNYTGIRSWGQRTDFTGLEIQGN